MNKVNLSAIILTYNEEEIIKDCLESVKWADEIVIVDNGSTDKTLDIVKKFGVKNIVKSSGGNFSNHRNFGAKAAKGKWLLYVDADERVTPELRGEILKIIKQDNDSNSRLAAFAIPRKNIRLTKVLYYGGWWPDYVLRLMKKEGLKTWKGELHEQPEIEGEVGYLKEAFLHYSHRGSLEHKLNNTINWSKVEAQKLFDADHPPMNTARFASAMIREFHKRMIKYQAFRDGTEGFMEAIYQVFSVFITYARLWEMQIKNKEK